MVEVTWDQADVATGTPIWRIDFGLRLLYDRTGNDEAGRPALGKMKIHAHTGEVLLFSIE